MEMQMEMEKPRNRSFQRRIDIPLRNIHLYFLRIFSKGSTWSLVRERSTYHTIRKRNSNVLHMSRLDYRCNHSRRRKYCPVSRSAFVC